MAKGDITVTIQAGEIMHTSISRSKRGFNEARIVSKKGDNEYMALNYEWEGNNVPDFILDMMDFMKANKEELASVKEENIKDVPEGVLEDLELLKK